jgi:hypothetical protein
MVAKFVTYGCKMYYRELLYYVNISACFEFEKLSAANTSAIFTSLLQSKIIIKYWMKA